MWAHLADMKQPHHAAAPAVPVSMPQLVLDVRADGTMTALLDGQPVTPPVGAGPWRRAGFARIIDHATRERQVPVRVTVHESDGSTFTDILPATRRSRRQPPTAQPEPTTMARRAEPVPIDGGHGFIAGEDVAIALVTSHTDASHHGQVRALLDPTIIAATHAQEVVLIGRVSGTITIRDLP